jgi:hypothetical protein
MDKARVESRKQQTQRDLDHRALVGACVAVWQAEGDPPRSHNSADAEHQGQESGVDAGKRWPRRRRRRPRMARPEVVIPVGGAAKLRLKSPRTPSWFELN